MIASEDVMRRLDDIERHLGMLERADRSAPLLTTGVKPGANGAAGPCTAEIITSVKASI